jgi:hypothetical protein
MKLSADHLESAAYHLDRAIQAEDDFSRAREAA